VDPRDMALTPFLQRLKGLGLLFDTLVTLAARIVWGRFHANANYAGFLKIGHQLQKHSTPEVSTNRKARGQLSIFQYPPSDVDFSELTSAYRYPRD
jgi:hypothetical protein